MSRRFVRRRRKDACPDLGRLASCDCVCCAVAGQERAELVRAMVEVKGLLMQASEVIATRISRV
jgi:hypothetical protein